MGQQKKPAYQIKHITSRKIERLLVEGPWSRAMLAKLRRGIGKHPGELPELFEVILGDMPDELYGKSDEPSYAVWAIYTALTLFAAHQQGKDRPMSVGANTETNARGNSLGAAVGFLVKQDRKREIAFKRRFDAAITANEFTEFAHHARGLIQLLKAENITLDYPGFAEDLYWFQFDEIRNKVRLRWGQDYYHIRGMYDSKESGGELNGKE